MERFGGNEAKAIYRIGASFYYNFPLMKKSFIFPNTLTPPATSQQ
jgi:hypothetical protein